MSLSPRFGAFGARHWSFMAAVMAQALRRADETRTLLGSEIPLDVRRSAQQFLQIALDPVDHEFPTNPSASFENFAMAEYALALSQPGEASTPSRVSDHLRRFRALVDQLVPSGPDEVGPLDLDEAQAAQARMLAEVFEHLHATAEADAYESVVRAPGSHEPRIAHA